MNLGKMLKPNLDKIGITLLLSLITFFLYVILFHPEPVHATIFLSLIPLYIVSSLLYRFLAKNIYLLRAIRWIIFTPLTVLAIVSAISQIVPDNPPKDFLITRNFVDLEQVDNFSKFRSCIGHRNMPQYTDEPNSSMKHYMTSNIKQRNEEGDRMKIFAPFDGYIVQPLSQGITVVPASTRFLWWPFNQWRFNVEPAYALPEYMGVTSKVKAGDLIGYADKFRDEPAAAGQDFFQLDLIVGVTAIPPQLKDGNPEPWKKMDSVFNYMSDEVFAEYQAAIPGVMSRDDFTIPIAWRKDHPCEYDERGGPYFDSNKPEDKIIEEQNVYLGVGVHDLEDIKEAGRHCSSKNLWGRPSCESQRTEEPKRVYACPDQIEYSTDVQTSVVENDVKRLVGADEQNWIEKNCKF